MGYETRITVVRPFTSIPGYPDSGEFIASIELGKCGDGRVGTEIAFAIAQAKNHPMALHPDTPDRQQEAVKYLRHLDGDNEDYLKKLAADIEDGYITKDRYGDFLGVSTLNEFISALEEELAEDNWYKFKIALDLLKSIKENCADWEKLKVITYSH